MPEDGSATEQCLIIKSAGRKNWNYCDNIGDIVKNPFCYWSTVKGDIHSYISFSSRRDYLEYPVSFCEHTFLRMTPERIKDM